MNTTDEPGTAALAVLALVVLVVGWLVLCTLGAYADEIARLLR